VKSDRFSRSIQLKISILLTFMWKSQQPHWEEKYVQRLRTEEDRHYINKQRFLFFILNATPKKVWNNVVERNISNNVVDSFLYIYFDWKVCNRCTGTDRCWRFHKFEAPRFAENWHMKVLRLSALRTGDLYPRRYLWYSFLLDAESNPGP